MISFKEFEDLCTGHFAALTLEGGPTIQGYAGGDPAHANCIRVDGLALEDDGTVSQFSLCLERSQIQTANLLPETPTITDFGGIVHCMRPGFWE